MSDLKLTLGGDRRSYHPGDEVKGTADWSLDVPPSRVEARLFWAAIGSQSEDVTTVDVYPFESPGPRETREFVFRLPNAPCGFSGNLFSIQWAIELVATPCRETGRVEFVVSPANEPISVEEIERDDPFEKMPNFIKNMRPRTPGR